MLFEPRSTLPSEIVDVPLPLTDTARPTAALLTVLDEGVADAVMLVAPEDTALMVMVAIPLLFVRAVAEAGSNATRELDAAKVTTVLAAAAPSEFKTVAVAVIFDPVETELEESARAIADKSVVVVLLAVLLESVSLLPPQAIREKSSIRDISSHDSRQKFFLTDFVMLISLL
jgi:hypothetical protein